MKTLAAAGFADELRRWNLLVEAVWNSSSPADMIAGMGSDAANNFAASALKGQHLAALSALLFSEEDHTANLQKIATIAAKAQPTTSHEDGTVTINPPA